MSGCRFAIQRKPVEAEARESFTKAVGDLVDFDRHAHPPPARPKESTRADGTSPLSDKIIFGQPAHRRRLAAALQSRLYPNTGLHAKQLAFAIGVTPETVLNWANCSSDPSSWKIGLLFVFYGIDFWLDVYGPIGIAMQRRYQERVAEDRARHAREAEALRMLGMDDD